MSRDHWELPWLGTRTLVTAKVPWKGSGIAKPPGKAFRDLDRLGSLAADRGPPGDEPEREEHSTA